MPKTAFRAALLTLALALCGPLAACDGNAFCPDCKACPSLCQAGYVCKEATLLEFGGAKSYHCGLAETKPALTVPGLDATRHLIVMQRAIEVESP